MKLVADLIELAAVAEAPPSATISALTCLILPLSAPKPPIIRPLALKTIKACAASFAVATKFSKLRAKDFIASSSSAKAASETAKSSNTSTNSSVPKASSALSLDSALPKPESSAVVACSIERGKPLKIVCISPACLLIASKTSLDKTLPSSTINRNLPTVKSMPLAI